jgi:hypothetical protein
MVEAARDEIQVRHLSRRRGRPPVSRSDELDVEPGAPGGIGDLRRQPVAQRLRVVAQSGRRAKLLQVDLGLQVGGPK